MLFRSSSPIPAHRPELPCPLLTPEQWLRWKFTFKTMAFENRSGKEASCAEAVSAGALSPAAALLLQFTGYFIHLLDMIPPEAEITWILDEDVAFLLSLIRYHLFIFAFISNILGGGS